MKLFTKLKSTKTIIVLSLVLFAALATVVSLPPSSVHASGSATLSLSPSSQTVTTGSDLVLTVSLNPSGSSINTVQSELSYPSANFSLVSVTPAAPFAGAFPSIITSTSGSNNLIDFAAGSATSSYTYTPITTTQTVVTVTLQANTAGSSLPITLASVCPSTGPPASQYALNCSAAYDSTSSANDLSTATGGTYTVSAGTPAPTVSFTANPTTITSGNSSTLTWSVTNSAQSNPTSCSASAPSGFSISGTSGSQLVSPTSTTTYTISCTGPGGTSSPASSVTVTVTLASGCYQSSTLWQNNSFTAQTSNFTFNVDATPNANDINSVVGLSNGAASAYKSLGVIVRFNPTGDIDAINDTGQTSGGNYKAVNTIPYTQGTSYHFTLTVNPVSYTYSATVTPSGGSAIILATNYGFRYEQANQGTFNNWAVYQDPTSAGSQTACNGVAATVSSIQGDINGDGHVTIIDLSLLLSSYGSPNSACVTAPQYTCDIDNQGSVNIIDLSILLSQYGE